VERFTEVLRIILPVMLMLGLGVLCRQRRLIGREGIDTLKTVAVQIGLPAVLLHTFAAAEYSLATLVVPLIMFALCVLAWQLGRLGRRALGLKSRFVPFLTTGFEAGMLGYALFPLLYGTERLADFARIDLGQVLFVFTLYKILIGMEGRSEKPAPRQLLREMLLSPIILAILAGVLLGATGLYRAMGPSGAAGVLDACTDFISAPVSALILLAIGYDLVFRDIPWREALKAVGLRLVIMAALGAGLLGLFRLLWPQAQWDRAVWLMFLLPPPYVLPVFSTDEEQRVYLSSVLSLSTLVTLLGFVVLAVIA
jgi:predicted permease